MTKNNKQPQSPFFSFLILFFITFIAFTLRYAGITWGLPYSYHPDEHYMVDFTTNFMNGNWNPVSFNPRPYIYGPVLMDIVALIAKFLSFINSFIHIQLPQQHNILFLGRFIVALLGALTVIPIFKLTNILSNRISAVLASLFFSFSYLHITHSHYFTVDAPVTFFIAVTLYYCQKLSAQSSRLLYVLIALFASLSFATKFTASILFFPIIISHFISMPSSKKIFRIIFAKNFLLLCLIFALATILLLNYMLFPFENFHSFIEQLKINALISRILDTGCIQPNKCLYYSSAIFESFKPFIAILAVIGIFLFFLRHKKFSLPLLSFSLLFFIIHCLMHNFSDRYILPLLPPVAILIALTINEFLSYCKRIRILHVIAYLIIAVQLSVSLFEAVRLDYLYLLPENHDAAVNWIKKFIPPNAAIMCEGQFPRMQGKNVTKLLDFFTRKQVLVKRKAYDFIITSSMSNAAFQKLMKCENRKNFYGELAKKHYLIKTFWLENVSFIQQEIKLFRNKESILPPFFSLRIQPAIDNNNTPILFLDKKNTTADRGGFIINNNHFNYINSTVPLDSLPIYLANMENHAARIIIASGWHKQSISLAPREKKIIAFSPQLHFPYFKYLYKITMKSHNKTDRVYVKIITDSFNEGLMLWHLNKPQQALSKIKEALLVEKDNPILHYFRSLLLYENSRLIEASESINKLHENWLQLFNSTYIPRDFPVKLPSSYQLYSLPPGYYTISLSLASSNEDAMLKTSISSQTPYLNEKAVLTKGITDLSYTFFLPHIDDVRIQLETNQNIQLNNLRLHINKEKLQSDISLKSLSVRCWEQ